MWVGFSEHKYSCEMLHLAASLFVTFSISPSAVHFCLKIISCLGSTHFLVHRFVLFQSAESAACYKYWLECQIRMMINTIEACGMHTATKTVYDRGNAINGHIWLQEKRKCMYWYASALQSDRIFLHLYLCKKKSTYFVWFNSTDSPRHLVSMCNNSSKAASQSLQLFLACVVYSLSFYFYLRNVFVFYYRVRPHLKYS